MKAKTTKIKYDAALFFDKAEEKLDAGDFESAIHFFYKSYKAGGGVDSLIALSETYAEMGEVAEGLNYLFRALDMQPKNEEVCLCLSQAFADLDDEETSLFYLSPSTSIKKYHLLLDQMEKSDPFTQKQKPVRLLQKNDGIIIDVAKKMLLTEDAFYAEEILSTIKTDSDHYQKAASMRAMILADKGKYKQLLELTTTALSKGENIELSCWQIAAYHFLKDKENKKRAIEFVENLKLNPQQSMIAVMAYVKIGDHKRVIRHTENVLQVDPFNKKLIITLAKALYLSKDFANAKREIVSAARLFPEDVTIKQIAKEFFDQTKCTSLYPTIDKKTANEWVDQLLQCQIDNMTTAADGNLNKSSDFESLNQKVLWLYQNKAKASISNVALMFANFPDWHQFFKERLIDNTIDSYEKRAIMFALLLNKTAGPIGIVIDGLYFRHKPKHIKLKIGDKGEFVDNELFNKICNDVLDDYKKQKAEQSNSKDFGKTNDPDLKNKHLSGDAPNLIKSAIEDGEDDLKHFAALMEKAVQRQQREEFFFHTGYCKAFVTLSFMDCRFEDKLYKITNQFIQKSDLLFKSLIENQLEVFSPQADALFAAVLVFLTSKTALSIKNCAHIFDVCETALINIAAIVDKR